MKWVENPTIPRPYDGNSAFEDLSQVPGKECFLSGWVSSWNNMGCSDNGNLPEPCCSSRCEFYQLGFLTALLSEPNEGINVTVLRHEYVPKSVVKPCILFLAGV